MESARELAERPLPPISQLRGTQYPSESPERVSAQYFHEWVNFEATVLQAYNSLDLTGLVPRTHDHDNEFVVGSELGLTGRFTKHLCDAVIRALSVTSLSDLKFADHQTVQGYHGDKVPDVILLSLSNESPRLVIELKTFWTFPLESHSVRRPRRVLEAIEHQLGQVVRYMRVTGVRFGVLSTYKSTVFVRRTADFRFELSVPIPHDAVRPSLRQCLIGISVLAADSPEYVEPDTFDASQLYCPTAEHAQASFRVSGLRRHSLEPKTGEAGEGTAPQSGSAGEHIGVRSILFGSDDGVARFFINCKDRVLGTGMTAQGKALFETTWDGQPAIAKCWGKSFYQQYAHETRTYQKLALQNPNGYGFFTADCYHGTIHCSSLFSTGFILIMKKVPGVPLVSVWDSLSSNDKAFIYSELHKAILVLRNIGVVCLDTGKHNILYDRPTRQVTMVDFEMVRLIEPNTHPTDAPELWSIFGPPESPQYRHTGG